MARLRIPLHIKVMFSYLVVVGLVLAPMVIYLETTVDATLYQAAAQQLKRAGALGLSAALVMSLVAALAVSRPLRRIASAARAFAAGDFGHDVTVRTRDELGDAADALRELVVRLRAVLLEVGSGRATLQALVDELPCGVILYDAAGQPALVSARARELCELVGAEESLRAAAIARLSDRSTAGPAPLSLPWAPERALEIRWAEVYSKEAHREHAAVIVDRTLERTHDAVARALNGSVLLLREAARVVANEDLRVGLEVEADRLDRWASWREPERREIGAVAIGELCALAAQQIEARTQLKKIKLRFELPDGPTHVAEAGGRTCRVLRGFLESAVKASKKGSNLSITGEVHNGCVRLSVRTKALDANLSELEPLAAVAGGEVGSERNGDASIFWLTLPRA